MSRFSQLFFVSACVAALTANAAPAEEPTADEMRAHFTTHLTGYGKTRSLAKPVKHRGLVIVGEGSTQEVEFEPVRAEDQVNIRIGFGFDSDILMQDQIAKLGPLCQVMTEMEETRFRVIGHTDASGEGAYNDSLSLRRAIAVQSYLNSGCGIGAARLQAVGVGERYLADAGTPDAAINRRVEVQAVRVSD